jgi:hypothetical protein
MKNRFYALLHAISTSGRVDIAFKFSWWFAICLIAFIILITLIQRKRIQK